MVGSISSSTRLLKIETPADLLHVLVSVLRMWILSSHHLIQLTNAMMMMIRCWPMVKTWVFLDYCECVKNVSLQMGRAGTVLGPVNVSHQICVSVDSS